MSAKRKTHDEFIELCKNREDFKEYKFLSKYIKSSEKIKIKHLKCGNIFEMTPHNFYYNKHKCPYCNKGSIVRRKSLKEVKSFIEKDNLYKLLDDLYVNSKTKMSIRCNKCNNIFKMNWNDFNSGYRCPYCAKNKKIMYNDLKEKIPFIDSDYVLFNDKKSKNNFKNVHSIIKIKHLKCNKVFSKSYNNFRNGQRCPYCNEESNESIAIRNIKNFLNENNISFKTEVTLKGLINPKTNKKLRIDFYIPEINTYIEYDGKQHFEWSKNGHFTYKKYIALKERDSIKDNYFKENNLNLVRINYKEDELKKLKSIIFND